MCFTPRLQRTVARADRCVVFAVSQVEFPIQIFDVLQHRDDTRFEVGEREILIDTCNDNTLSDARNAAKTLRYWASNPSEFGTGAGQQRMRILSRNIAGIG